MTYHQTMLVTLLQCVQDAVQDLHVHPEHRLLRVVSDLSHEALNKIASCRRAG